MKNLRKLFAEYLGTFGIVFFGTGSIIVNELSSGTVSHVGVAVTFGVIVTLMIYSFSEISGAHLNPAVTIALLKTDGLNFLGKVSYILSQTAWAVSASLLLHLLFPSNAMLGSTIPSGAELQSFVLEFILTFFLMIVILQATHYQSVKPFAGLLIGLTVMIEAMFAGPICGASMNPARSLGPALVSGHFESIWLYIVAPIAGAILGKVVHRILTVHGELKKEVKAQFEDAQISSMAELTKWTVESNKEVSLQEGSL
ncbi:MAG TPA: aquaporin [Ignavibacteriales bacterium]|nr:aquaporin [Ignavibacteriales bacterium]